MDSVTTRGDAGSDADDVIHSCATMERALSILERRWMGLILRALLGGPRRFNEILTAVPGIADTLLTQRLRELETNHLVERRVLGGPPVRVEYELTEAGRDLERVLREIAAWAHRWLPPESP